MSKQNQDNSKNLKKRNIAVALMVVGLMVIFYVVTVVRIQQGLGG